MQLGKSRLMKKLLWLCLPLFFWVFLSGQFRKEYTGRPNALDAGDLSIFKKGPRLTATPQWVYWVSGIGVFGIGAGIFFFNRYKKRQAEQQLQKVSDEKAYLRLDVILSKLNVLQPERKLLEEIADSTHPNELLPMVESSEHFENRVDVYKKKKPETRILKQIYNLRHKLGFDFHNKRANFITTQMLAGGIKVECQIPHPAKKILFVTPVLHVTETQILLKPPTIKKKPVNLKRFPSLICRVRREDEADYEFTVPILDQVTGKSNAVIMGHTKDIRKMFIRESERVEVDIVTSFYIISEDQLDAIGGSISSAKSDMVLESMNGKIVDMSIGGLKIVTDETSKPLKPGDVLVFHLQGAGLRDDLMAKILRVNDTKDSKSLHMQFFRSRELERMKIKKFLFRMQKGTPGTKSTPANPPSKKPATAINANERKALLR